MGEESESRQPILDIKGQWNITHIDEYSRLLQGWEFISVKTDVALARKDGTAGVHRRSTDSPISPPITCLLWQESKALLCGLPVPHW